MPARRKGASLMVEDPGLPYWRSWLERVVSDPSGCESLELRDLVAARGVRAFQSSPVRAEAQRALQQVQDIPAGLKFLLTRLKNAGLSPAYADYVGASMLTAHL